MTNIDMAVSLASTSLRRSVPDPTKAIHWLEFNFVPTVEHAIQRTLRKVAIVQLDGMYRVGVVLS